MDPPTGIRTPIYCKIQEDTMKVIELFSGIGATRVAIGRVAERLGFEVEHVAQCDIDRHAVKSYQAIFGDTPNLGDITALETLPECDLLSWTFPCTDLSKAGKHEGMDEGSGTRSALGWEVIRLLGTMERKPEWLLMENVPQVHSKGNMPQFQRMIDSLSAMGYTSVWHDMNGKDHGVAQNRNRTIMVSHLGGPVPEFGKPRDSLDRCLRDYLEKDVPAKYYLTESQVEHLVWKNDKNRILKRGFDFKPRTDDEVACYITSRSGQRETDNYVMCEQVAALNREGWHESADRVYGTNALSPTINTGQGGGHEVKIAEERDPLKVVNGSKKGHLEADDGDGIILGFYTGGQTARGRVQKGMCPTLQTGINAAVLLHDGKAYTIRKLTPRECWRLFGRTDAEFDAARDAGTSDTQLYKQAGNSIIVEVLEDALMSVLTAGDGVQTRLDV